MSEEHRAFERWMSARENLTVLTPDFVEEGVRLARARRSVMREWMLSDPEAALQRAIGFAGYSRLPEAVRAEVEEPFSIRGEWLVLPDCAGGGLDSHLLRQGASSVSARNWNVTAHGWRKAATSKENTALQGARLDEVAAVRNELFQKLSGADLEAARQMFPVANQDRGRSFGSRRPLGTDAVAAVAGGKIFWFADDADLSLAETTAREMERRPGPHTGMEQVMQAAADAAHAEPDWEELTQASMIAASAWTESPKTVLCIVVDFPDMPPPDFSPEDLAANFNGGARQAIEEMSYGKTTIVATAANVPVVRMPNPSTHYMPHSNQNVAMLHDHALASAATAGVNVTGYDIRVVAFTKLDLLNPHTGNPWGGWAGGSRMSLQNTNNIGTIVHELGHNYGLGHASSRNPTGLDPFGSGVHEEYGDIFDRMGSGPLPRAHFHAFAKKHLNWIPDTDIITVNRLPHASHLVRLYPADNPASSGTRGFAIRENYFGDHLWLSYRQQFSSNPTLSKGLYINWNFDEGSRASLLDTTPGSTEGKQDAGVLVGRTFFANRFDAYITPVAIGGFGAQEYLDVQVNIGVYDYLGNQAPTANITPGTVQVRTSVEIDANGIDPDGDALAYLWDTDNGVFAGNVPKITRRWVTGGVKNFGVTVSDMKGRTAQANRAITVTDPVFTWTSRSSGTGAHLNDIAASPSLAVAVGGNGATVARSSDGVTWAASRFSNGVTLTSVCWTGSVFIAAGYHNNDYAGHLYTSADGIGWTVRLNAGLGLVDVASSGATHVALADDGVVWVSKSPDGATWSQATLPAQDFDLDIMSSVVFLDGKFFVSGQVLTEGGTFGTNALWQSFNGSNWTIVGVGGYYDLHSLNDRLFCGNPGMRYSDPSGQTWNPVANMNGKSPSAHVFGGGLYYAFNNHPSNPEDLISEDGQHWEAAVQEGTPRQNAGVFFKGRFITVGNGGSIRQSGEAAGDPAAPPVILQQPVTQSANTGGSALFTVSVSSQTPLTYDWRKYGVSLGAPNLPVLSLTGISAADSGAYTVVVSNNKGILTSEPAGLVVDGAPLFLRHPASIAAYDETPVSFIAQMLGGDGNYGYKWEFDDGVHGFMEVPGANVATLDGIIASAATRGRYRVTVSTTGFAPVTSAEAVLSGPTAGPATHQPEWEILAGFALPDGQIGRPYALQPRVKPDEPASNLFRSPTSYAASGLPAGLSIHNSTGLISGIPAAFKATHYNVTLTAKNKYGSAKVNVTLFINPLPGGLLGVFTGPVERSAPESGFMQHIAPGTHGLLGGRIDFTVASSGKLSGKLTLGRTVHPFRSSLKLENVDDTQATATAEIKRRIKFPGQPAFDLPLTLHFTLESDTGAIIDGGVEEGTASVALSGWRKPWFKSQKATVPSHLATDFAGYYTTKLELVPPPEQADSSLVPVGRGFLSFTVSPNTGALKLSGRLADGSALTMSTFAGPAGQILLFRPLYPAAAQGSLLGTLEIEAVPEDPNQNLVTGEASWNRPPNPAKSNRLYKEWGFGVTEPEIVAISGGRYFAPPAWKKNGTEPNSRVLKLTQEENQIQVKLEGAGIKTSWPAAAITGEVSHLNKVSFPPLIQTENPRKLILSFTPNIGLFQGVVTLTDPDPGNPAKAITRAAAYRGLIVGGEGSGYFILNQLPGVDQKPSSAPQEGGKVRIIPLPNEP